MIFFIKLDCSDSLCKTCYQGICSECLNSSYYLYDNFTCHKYCEEEEGFYVMSNSSSNQYCNSNLNSYLLFYFIFILIY